MNSSYIIESKVHCYLYRFAGFLLLFASIFNILVMIQYFIQHYFDEKHRTFLNRLSSIINGMFISSILVIITGIPIVVLQCFNCEPLLSYELLCHIHGFMCLATGLFNMYIIAFLSFARYLSVLHKTSQLNRLLEHHCDLITFCCILIACCWSLPPLFNLGNRFVREGAGFYCSLDWNNSSILSRIFLYSLILFNYIIPFILLVYSNLRICCILRRLLNSHNRITHLSTPKALSLVKTSYTNNQISLKVNLRKCLSDVTLKETTNRLHKLKIDRRYALLTAVITIQYLIVWTPYACIELLNLTGGSLFIQKNPFLPTFCALLAKLSLILNPIILIYTSKLTKT